MIYQYLSYTNVPSAALTEQSPLKPVGSAGEVAKMIVFLADDAASYITGADLVMDGRMVLA
ncbi:hypothetical protein DCM91_00365 [Chitinophaga costaii]|uniref:SDR family oxidoreductase n=1 Tax=Chitinophaga costaii TaxID=1335309 RepID=UPI000B7EA9B5|nr:SDR family oxidoreductase [Chitinophaga costaii]PUZ29972.1 hypothetical protein DCM91_00365 [Chitinophaga costaii]